MKYIVTGKIIAPFETDNFQLAQGYCVAINQIFGCGSAEIIMRELSNFQSIINQFKGK